MRRCAGARSEFALTELVRFVTSANPTTVDLRARYGIPSTAAAEVSLVTEHEVCARGALAADTVRGRSFAGPVHVYRMGTFHVVDSERGYASRARRAFVFDSTWRFRGPIGLTIVD